MARVGGEAACLPQRSRGSRVNEFLPQLQQLGLALGLFARRVRLVRLFKCSIHVEM